MKLVNVQRLGWAVALVLMAAGTAVAEVKPHALFTEGVVLQQGVPLPVWGTARPGERVTVELAGQKVSVVADAAGQWKVQLNKLTAGGPLRMTFQGDNSITLTNVLVGEVWVCSGQSNMAFHLLQATNGPQTAATANDPQLRLFTVPGVTADTPQQDVDSKWQLCTPASAANFSAVAYFFGHDLRQARQVPVGLINSSWGGTLAEAWTDHATLAADPALKPILDRQAELVAKWDPVKTKTQYEEALAKYKAAAATAKAEGKPAPRAPGMPRDPLTSPNRPSCLYNAKIAPLLPFPIRGVIWYQGESNSGRAREYQTLFPAMIRGWRQAWGLGDFPFLFVQIAPHGGMVPEIREAQLLTWQCVPNTAMAVITDHGMANNIHPTEKEPVGHRLALAARALAYGEELEYSGPVFKALQVKDGKAVLTFEHVDGGLVAQGGALKGFTIAGAGKKFVAAQAVIEGQTVVVSSDQVAQPVAVRYGWANVPDVNLFNAAGLPATPFRTDRE